MVVDPSKVLVCSPQIFLTANWRVSLKQYYGERSILYIHELHQPNPQPNSIVPLYVHCLPSFVTLEESDPDLIPKVEYILTHSSDPWVVIMGRQTEHLRALHRVLIEKIEE